MNLLKTYVVLPTGHGLLIYCRRGARGAIRPLAVRGNDDIVGVAEVLCADMPSLNCDIGRMVICLTPLIEAAREANVMAYISNRDILRWHMPQAQGAICNS